MSYRSIDEIQNELAYKFFIRTKDARKASGRALGTFLELAAYYWIKENGFSKNLSIETKLPEFGNKSLTHNVEFTLHQIKSSTDSIPIDSQRLISANSIIKSNHLTDLKVRKASGNLFYTKDNRAILKNGLCIGETKDGFVLGYVDTSNHTYRITELLREACAMFECKRVGREGAVKGPQTIEKAKQGAYVAKAVSSLQKIRSPEGQPLGIYFDQSNAPKIGNYNELLKQRIKHQLSFQNFILTVGIVSNHGNWFTAKNKNKELEVLCNAYDYLLFLTDDGLANFICDIFSIPECLEAFEYSYTKVEGSARKNDNIFTKSCITYEADLKLSEYFRTNMPKINRWFNVLNQDDPSVENLIEQLRELVK